MTYIPDIYSGVTYIAPSTILTINQYKQMINYGGLTISGTLVINGDLILK
jgi:hypothetical protein